VLSHGLWRPAFVHYAVSSLRLALFSNTLEHHQCTCVWSTFAPRLRDFPLPPAARGFYSLGFLLCLCDMPFLPRQDNRGHAGTIGPGSLQWMLAGSGLQHSEMPATDGPNVGLQLWLTLPAADKMSPPDYQEVSADAVPTATSPDGAARVRVLAGDAYGVSAAVVTTSPILYLDVDVAAGGAATLPVPDGYVGFAYVLRGAGTVGANGVAAEHGSCCLLADGEAGPVTVTAGADGLRFVLVAGTPVREPIVKYGPFVMNTREEVVQAIKDYQAGRF